MSRRHSEREGGHRRSESAGDHEVLARAWHLIGTTHNWRSQAAEWRDASEQAVTHARETGPGPGGADGDGLAGPIVYGPVPVDEGFVSPTTSWPDSATCPRSRGSRRVRRTCELAAASSAGRSRAPTRGGITSMSSVRTSCTRERRPVSGTCVPGPETGHGEQVLRESYEMFERMGMNARRSTIAAHLGEAVLHQGRVDEARASASRASSSGRGTTSTTT